MKRKKELVLSLKKEIRRLKKEAAQLKLVVDYDHMLQFVLNRRGFNSRLLPIMHQVKSRSGYRKNHFYSIDEAACVFIDIDKFKKVNDTLGHDMGDRILFLLGKILRNKFRETDLICRWGGDEFVLMIFNSNKSYTAGKIRSVAIEFEKEALKLAPDIKPTISYGVSYLSEKLKDIPTLIKVAGQRMKADKSAKKLWRIWRA